QQQQQPSTSCEQGAAGKIACGLTATTTSVEERKGGYIATTKTTTLKFRASPPQQLIRAVIHAVMFGLGYLVMLLAMYYNGYVIISILIGALIGKFLCDWLTVQFEIHGGDEEEDVDGFTDEVPRQHGVEDATVCCG